MSPALTRVIIRYIVGSLLGTGAATAFLSDPDLMKLVNESLDVILPIIVTLVIAGIGAVEAWWRREILKRDGK